MKHRHGISAIFLAVCVICGLIVSAANANEPARGQAENIDRELLEGLDAELMDDLIPPEDSDLGDEVPSSARDRLDEELLENLGANAEAEQDPNPLSRAGRRMQRVEELIGRAKSGTDTQELQRQIMDDLDTLIQRARQQAQKMQSSQQSQQSSKRSKSRQPSQQRPTEGGVPRDEPADDSSERVGESNAQRPDMMEMNTLLKELWGHLPEREREQVLNAQIEQFLPKYELLIEAYFKRLLDRQAEGR